MAANAPRIARLSFRRAAGPTRRFPEGNEARWEAWVMTGRGDAHSPSLLSEGSSPSSPEAAVEEALRVDAERRARRSGPHWAFGLSFINRNLLERALEEALDLVSE